MQPVPALRNADTPTATPVDDWCLGTEETPARAAAAARVPDYPPPDSRNNPYGPVCVVAWIADSGDHLSCNDDDLCSKFEVRVKWGPPSRWTPLPPLDDASGWLLTRPAVAVGPDRLPIVAWSFVVRGRSQVHVARWSGQAWRYDSFAGDGTDFSNPRFLIGDDGVLELAIDEDHVERRYVLEADSWVATTRAAPRNGVASTSAVLDWAELEQGDLDSPCTEEGRSRQVSSRFVSSAQSPSDPERCLVTWVEDSGSHIEHNEHSYATSFEVRAKLGRRDAWMPLRMLGDSVSGFGTMSAVIGADERPVVAYSATGRYWSYVRVGIWNGTEWLMWSPRVQAFGDAFDDPRLSTTAEGKAQLDLTRNRVPERYVLEGDEWIAAPAPLVQ